MEQRKYPRINVLIPATLQDDSATMSVLIRNISRGGVGIESAEQPEINKIYGIQFAVPCDGQHSLNLRAQLLWTTLLEPNKYLSGMKFAHPGILKKIHLWLVMKSLSPGRRNR